MLYFAYGSNLCAGWLTARTPSARHVGTARLGGHAFRFHKYSACDRSGKADAFRTGEEADVVWGALIEMSDRDRRRLGRIEGGYDDREVEVEGGDGPVAAFTYIARERWIRPRSVPFDWYKRLIVEGGRARGLPGAYVDAIEAMAETVDPNRRRGLKAEKALRSP